MYLRGSLLLEGVNFLADGGDADPNAEDDEVLLDQEESLGEKV